MIDYMPVDLGKGEQQRVELEYFNSQPFFDVSVRRRKEVELSNNRLPYESHKVGNKNLKQRL